mmetsp:Transcript_4701/g.29651  ORF Transcript_4701/g.29651 Transcript_4701/m.29651 type:complete len:315 (+) Transcript_4701:2139-3083(+)
MNLIVGLQQPFAFILSIPTVPALHHPGGMGMDDGPSRHPTLDGFDPIFFFFGHLWQVHVSDRIFLSYGCTQHCVGHASRLLSNGLFGEFHAGVHECVFGHFSFVQLVQGHLQHHVHGWIYFAFGVPVDPVFQQLLLSRGTVHDGGDPPSFLCAVRRTFGSFPAVVHACAVRALMLHTPQLAHGFVPRAFMHLSWHRMRGHGTRRTTRHPARPRRPRFHATLLPFVHVSLPFLYLFLRCYVRSFVRWTREPTETTRWRTKVRPRARGLARHDVVGTFWARNCGCAARYPSGSTCSKIMGMTSRAIASNPTPIIHG